MATQFSSTNFSFTSAAPLLRVSDVQKIFSVSRQTVVNWLNTGQLHGMRVGGSIRVRQEDVQSFVDASQRARVTV
jgi:excisionase family DNA binding protein